MHSKCKTNRFTAVVIGKKLLLLLVASILATVTCISLLFVAVHGIQDRFYAFNERILIDAIPVAAAADDVTLGSDITSLVYWITGLDVDKHISNFKIFPYFCGVEDKIAYSQSVELDEIEMAIPVVKVDEQNNTSGGLKIKNETAYNIDTQALLAENIGFNMSTNQPQILIVHTHGTESYTQSEKYHYSDTDSARCEDIRYNVVRVGEELAKELGNMGFNVLHDKRLNDTPSYNNSYNKTLGVIEKYLQKYPSIQCVFDVHRDAVEQEDGTKVKFTTDINGEKVSQVMIVCGSDGLGLDNPDWQYNLSFALKIQNYLNNTYPGLMRPVNLRKERFNLHKTRGSLIFEFGTHGNTMDESLAAVKYLAEGIAKVLK